MMRGGRPAVVEEWYLARMGWLRAWAVERFMRRRAAAEKKTSLEGETQKKGGVRRRATHHRR
jgi:hypothetical protein